MEKQEEFTSFKLGSDQISIVFLSQVPSLVNSADLLGPRAVVVNFNDPLGERPQQRSMSSLLARKKNGDDVSLRMGGEVTLWL